MPAVSTTYNAASLRYKGETIDATYRFPVELLIKADSQGNIELAVRIRFAPRLTDKYGIIGVTIS